jgi:hypothetical protein
MGEDHPNKPHINVSGNIKSDTCHRNRGGWNCHCPHHHWHQSHHSGKFKSKTKEIKYNTFNNTGPHYAAQFNKPLKNIADHLQLIHENNVFKAVHNLLLIAIAIPPTPIGVKDPANKTGATLLPVTNVALYLSKLEHANAQDQKDKYDKNMDIAKAYVIVNHQCLSMLKNNLKAFDTTICC